MRQRPDGQRSDWFPRFALAGWLGGILIVGSALTATHLLALPVRMSQTEPPPKGDALPYSILHVLSTDCGCSARVAQTLLGDGPSAHELELVVVVGDDSDMAVDFVTRGFDVDWIRREQLSPRYGIEAVPTLAVFDPISHEPLYVGGYAPVRRAAPRHDEIIANVRHGIQSAAQPIMGCAVSRRLRTAIDPFSLKYIAGNDQ